MHNLIIVDDEPWVRDGIAELIDWTGHGVRLIGSYPDGVAALDGMRRSRHIPHLLVTDIRMPGMSGLDLIRQCAAMYPGIISVIVSGFEDFEYARSAIHLNVFEYLVKPVGKEVLIDTVDRLIQVLSARHASSGPDLGDDDPAETMMVRKARYFIESHLFANVGLQSVADAVGISPSYLSSVFHAVAGESFKTYVTRRRIEAAKQLMDDEPHLKVYEICERVAYHDVDHFTKMFKRYAGVTPIEYRRRRA